MRKLLICVLIISLIFPLAKTLWQNKDYYRTSFDLERAKGLYGISQYVRKENASWIADEILFAYAGWYYVNGGSPILVNPEAPPLGKYIIGFSISLFNNEKLPTVFFGLLCLFAFYLLSKRFIANRLLAFVPVALFFGGKLFCEQMVFLPLMEVFSLAFLILSIFYFIKGVDRAGYFFVSSLFAGFLISTRPWMATAPLFLAFFIYILMVEKSIKTLINWGITIPLSLIVLVLSYSKLFFEGYGLYRVLSVQKWILWYYEGHYAGKIVKVGSVWPFLYLNRWYVWWGDKPYLPIVQWTLLWPISITLMLLFVLVLLLSSRTKKCFLLKNKPDKKIWVVCLWSISYLLYLSIGNVNSRYILYLVPFCYLIGCYFISLSFSCKK